MTIFQSSIHGKRMWIPKHLHKKLQNKYAKFTMTQNRCTYSFIDKLNFDGRITIPEKFREELKDGKVVIKFEPLVSAKPKLERQQTCMCNNFDVLSMLPRNTLSGFDVLILEDGSKLVCRYSARGRPQELAINKWINKDFCRLLGYYRAEGGKPNLKARHGREFSFTNKSIPMIDDFVRIFRKYIYAPELKAVVRYNPEFKNDALAVIPNIVKTGINQNHIKIYEGERIRKFVIRLYAGSSLLAEAVDAIESKMRKIMIKQVCKECICEYFKGVIAGDGNLYTRRDKNGHTRTRLQIFEPDMSVMRDYVAMFKILGMKCRIVPSKSRMFTLVMHLNWNNLLTFQKETLAFLKPETISNAIVSHKRFRSLKIFMRLPNSFTTSEFRKISSKSYGYSATWVKDRAKEKLIEYVGKKDGINTWRLQLEAKNLISIFNSCKANDSKR